MYIHTTSVNNYEAVPMPCAGSLYCIWLCKPRLHGFEFQYEFLQDGAWSLKNGLVTSGRYLTCCGDLRDAPYKSPRAKPKLENRL